MPSRAESRATRAGKWLLAGVVPASVLALGSLHTTVLIVVTLAAAIAAALLWMDPPERSPRAARWVVVAFVVLLGATIVQALPLPASVVHVLAPENADVWARSLLPLGEPGPSWHPLSLAPLLTRIQILRGVLYGCVFLAAVRVTSTDGGSTFLERVIVASASVVALSALAHSAVHAERVFGIYKPRDAYGFYENRLGSLLNPNHLAAYLNMGALVALGAAVSRRGSLPRPLAVGGAILLAGTSVWAGSRGGTGSLLIGTVLVAAFALLRRGLSLIRRAESTLVVVALVAAGILIVLGASDAARGELGDRDMSKIGLALTTLRLVPLSPIFGVGRGAFETVFPAVREGTTYVTFLATENIATQWAVEWGVPVTIIAAGALAIAFRPRVVLTAARPAVGAWVAVVVVLLHELVDFHLEVPGVMVLACLCAALVTGGRESEERRSRRAQPSSRYKWFARACTLGAAPAVFAVLPALGHSLDDDRAELARISTDRGRTDEAFRSEVRASMLRYPAEPFFPLAGAVRAQLAADETPMPWIARAIERYPRFGRAHMILARSLAANGHAAQARLEYRLAYEYDLGMRELMLKEAPRLVGGPLDALQLVPEGAEGLDVLDKLSVALASRLPATASVLDAELLARESDAPGALRRQVEAALSDVANDHIWCSPREVCVERAVALAHRLVGRERERCDAHLLVARARIAGGESVNALDELERNIEQTSDPAMCLRMLVTLADDVGDKRRADRIIERAFRGGCGTIDACVDLYGWLGATAEARGNRVRAMTAYKRAYELSPERESYLIRYAELAAASDLLTDAIQAYTKLELRHPEDDRWRTELADLRVRAQKRSAAPRD